jgi:hypothetical protein
MGAACSTVTTVQEATGELHVLSARASVKSTGGVLTARSNDLVVKSVMAYIPFAVSQFYMSRTQEVNIQTQQIQFTTC